MNEAPGTSDEIEGSERTPCPIRVLIAIVTYNSADVITQCLQGFAYAVGLTAISVEIVVVDNASADETCHLVEGFVAEHPELRVQLVRCERNRGWGAGNNAALRAATMEPAYVLLCNPDAGIDAAGLLALVRALESRATSAAIAVPYIKDGNRLHLGALPEWGIAKFVLWDVIGDRLPTARFQRRFDAQSGVFPIPHGYASGSLALVSYPALVGAGLFDERIFLFNDDIDMSRSIARLGKGLVGTADGVGFHAGGQGSRIMEVTGTPTTREALALESELIFVEKWHGRHWAKLLALYRAHVFFRVRNALLRAKGNEPVDMASHRAPAFAYLKDRKKRK
jgi:GT2 family glycosyltransferase